MLSLRPYPVKVLVLAFLVAVAAIFFLWEYIETRFLLEVSRETLRLLYITSGILATLLLTTLALWLILTERKKYEVSLVEKDKYLAHILNASVEAIMGLDPQGIIESWNYGAEIVFGYRSHEMIGRPFSLLIAQGPSQEGTAPWLKELTGAKGYARNLELEGLRKDNTRIKVSLTATALRGKGEGPTGYSIIMDDITEQARLYELLQASEARYRDLIEYSPEMIHQVDRDRRFVAVNKTELQRLGYSLEEMQEMRLEDLSPEEHKASSVAHIDRVIQEGQSTAETVFLTKAGERIDVEIHATALYHARTGEFLRTRAFVRDITARKKAEEEIKYLNEYKESILGNLDAHLRVVDQQERVQYENRLFREHFGEGVGMKCYAFWDRSRSCEDCVAKAAMKTQRTQRAEFTSPDKKVYALTAIPIRNRDGSWSAVELIRDVTEQRRLERELLRTERLVAIGELAAGVAHEVNNPLGGIKNFLTMIEKEPENVPQTKEYLALMSKGINHIEFIVKKLTTFSRPHVYNKRECDLNQTVRDSLRFFSHRLGPQHVNLQMDLQPDIPSLYVDSDGISQVIVNLCLNALDAMPKGGELRIATCSCPRHNSCLQLSISDTGCGIREELLEQIFDPFFTTKDKEKGSGLGLSISKRIVEGHGGEITVQSREDLGSTFFICLPVAQAEALKGGARP